MGGTGSARMAAAQRSYCWISMMAPNQHGWHRLSAHGGSSARTVPAQHLVGASIVATHASTCVPAGNLSLLSTLHVKPPAPVFPLPTW
eukprot:352370-Chlamydomonas_euryale.AAC.3